jgi:hypothetical protein
MENTIKIKCEYCNQERDPKDIIEAECHRRASNGYGKQYVKTDKYKVCKDKPCAGYLQMSFEG